MSDNQQILRLLATLREEVAGIRSRQEELYEIYLSYKDQLHDLKRTVEEGLQGLPKSPYIAGQLLPAPTRIDGVEDLREILATYLHQYTDPRDTTFDPPQPVDPSTIELEPSDDPPRSRRRGRGGGGGGGRDMDLERGPDRGVDPLDLDGPEKKPSKKRRRSRGRRKKGGGGGKAESAGEASDKGEGGGDAEAKPKGRPRGRSKKTAAKKDE